MGFGLGLLDNMLEIMERISKIRAADSMEYTRRIAETENMSILYILRLGRVALILHCSSLSRTK